MNEMRLVEGLTSERVEDAQKRIERERRQGGTPSVDDMAAARGLVVAERRNSIFSDAWIPLAVLFIVVGFFIGRNVPCMTLGLMLLVMTFAGRWWRDRSLDEVSYTRNLDRTHIFPGETITAELQIANRKNLPLTWLQFTDMVDGPVRITSPHAPPLDSLNATGYVSTFAVRGQETLTRDVQFTFRHRGFYQLGPVTYESGDLFTLFTAERDHDLRQTIVVYPQVWPLEALGLPAKEPFGDLRVRRSLFTDPIKTMGVRDYEPRDRFRDIHWKATARAGKMQTKVYDPSTGMTAAVFLNVSTAERYWQGNEPELLERLVAVAASVANYGAEQGWGVGVYANGSVPRSDQPIRVPPGRSPNQLMHVLEALAAVTGYATGPVELLLQRESMRLPWVATLVVVTAAVPPTLEVTLNYLREAGRRVVLISLAQEPPPKSMHQILSYHIPADVPAFQPKRLGRDETAAALQAVSRAQEAALDMDAQRSGKST